MTTSTPSPAPDRAPRRGNRAFTLVEILIGAGLSAFILTAVMTTFLFLGRSGVNIQNYNDMESQSRSALEQFAQDVRQASAVTWYSDTSVALTVDFTQVIWVYSSGNLYRRSSSGTRRMISGIASFNYKAYNINGTELDLTDLSAAGRQTKQLQISLEAQRTSTTVARATNLVLSARYILRNKRVTT